MTNEVINCILAKTNHLRQYFQIPEEVVARFESQLQEIGETCTDAAGFEAAFAKSSLYADYLSFFTKYPAKAYQMTESDKAAAKSTIKQMLSEDKTDLAKGLVEDAVSGAALHAREENVKNRREQMIEEGTFDDYTRATNKLSSLRRLFKK